MEDVQAWRTGFWRSTAGFALLVGALVVHVALALWKTARRRTLRMPPAEAAQLVLGLAIPLLLAKHVAGTAGLAMIDGVEDSYTHVPVAAVAERGVPADAGDADGVDPCLHRPALLAAPQRLVPAVAGGAAHRRRRGAAARRMGLRRRRPAAVDPRPGHRHSDAGAAGDRWRRLPGDARRLRHGAGGHAPGDGSTPAADRPGAPHHCYLSRQPGGAGGAGPVRARDQPDERHPARRRLRRPRALLDLPHNASSTVSTDSRRRGCRSAPCWSGSAPIRACGSPASSGPPPTSPCSRCCQRARPPARRSPPTARTPTTGASSSRWRYCSSTCAASPACRSAASATTWCSSSTAISTRWRAPCGPSAAMSTSSSATASWRSSA